jgi:two-component system, sensor histidine kinase and response regulator
MNNPCLLVVDDEPNNFDVVTTLLSHHGYQFLYANSGQKALSHLDAYNPDLILLDVMMPGIDGIEVCRQIKALPQWQTVPIVMITALNSKTDLARCLNAGADDFVSKPIHSIELQARVQSMLRIRRQYHEIQAFSNLQANTIQVLESTLSELHGNLASKLSHELNTPLNGIIGSIELLRFGIETMNVRDIHEILDLANESAVRLETLTKKFQVYLELELISSRKESFKSATTHLSTPAFQPMLSTLAERRGRRNNLAIKLPETTLALSEHYVSLMLSELLDNALKFSHAGTPITIEGQLEDQRLHLSVHNLGSGMTLEQIAQINALRQFERKTQAQQGMGMGLNIVKKIIQIANGEFHIHSVPQQETTVHVKLPVAVAQ